MSDFDKKIDQASALFEQNRFEDAARFCRQLLLSEPTSVALLNLLGMSLVRMGNLADAANFFQQATEVDPTSPSAFSNYGNVLKDLGERERAMVQYVRAIKLDAMFADAHYNLGNLQLSLQLLDEAILSFSEAIQCRPDWAECYLNRGNAYQLRGRWDEALADYNRVIALRPLASLGYVNRANLRHPQYGAAEINRDFKTALELEPNEPTVLFNYAQHLHGKGQFADAASVLAKLYKISPDKFYALGEWLHCKALIADWSNWEELTFEMRVRLAQGEAVIRPFGMMGISQSELELQSCAQLYTAAKHPSIKRLEPSRKSHTKIRLGYIGGEFRSQAVSLLMTGVFEMHNREQFDVYAFDNGWDDGSEIRRRQVRAFKEIIDISQLGDMAVAQIIADKEIDILVDLSGFFGLGRQGVVAFKPSPVQVVYMGCPGTMGTDYMDYLIADKQVIPLASTIAYDEKIVHLPNSYYAFDDQREVSPRVFTRQEMGLPEQGFVFCCFNNNYKILPATFAQWMRILEKVEGSVLWLFENCPEATFNLRQEAAKRGVHPDRLVFAKPLPPPEHLARHALADLFLDTLPYNAHTTASDALWMGLPLITLVGTTFPGRVASSLLLALEVPELITHKAEAYETLAVELATHPEKLKAVREKILAHRHTKPLFDTRQFTRYFEQALLAMYERHQAGLKPEAITIKK